MYIYIFSLSSFFPLLLPPSCSKSDMSRLRLAAGGAIMKLAQEPCYHDIITPEQFQLCGLVINVSLILHLFFSPWLTGRKPSHQSVQWSFNWVSSITEFLSPHSQDECYQVRQIFAQKLHLALVKLLLPLEYLAVFALCAKDPVKERRAHARQCLLKNISVRREYIKQNPLAQGQCLSCGSDVMEEWHQFILKSHVSHMALTH